MSFAAAGTLASVTAASQTTLAHTNNAVGNVLVVGMKITSTSITISSITGGGAAGWVKIAGPDNDGTRSQELWMGTVNATGAQTITVTFSSSNSGITTDIDAQEFSSSLGTGAVWTADVSGWLSNAASTTVTYPTLAPLLSATELYIGQVRIPAGAGWSGLTSGFTGQTDLNGNRFIYGLAVTASVSPSETNTTNAANATLAALVTDTPPASGTDSAAEPATAQSALAGGSGSWVNAANATGAPDGSFATWTAP